MTREDRYVMYAAAALAGIAARPNVDLTQSNAVIEEAHGTAVRMLLNEPPDVRDSNDGSELVGKALVEIKQCLEALLSFKKAEHERVGGIYDGPPPPRSG